MSKALDDRSVWPLTITVKRGARVVAVAFDDGARFDIPFMLLRVESPSAEVQGHSAAQKQIVRGKSDVMITGAEPVGRYGVRLIFDDGHNSGLFTWDWLYRLGRDQNALLRAYQTALESTSPR
jgi:DUF971 family protein